MRCHTLVGSQRSVLLVFSQSCIAGRLTILASRVAGPQTPPRFDCRVFHDEEHFLL
jgi:hypothetical protein